MKDRTLRTVPFYIFFFITYFPIYLFAFDGNLPIESGAPVYYKKLDALVFNWNLKEKFEKKDILFELYFIDPSSYNKKLIYNSVLQSNKISILKPKDILKEAGLYCYYITYYDVNNNINTPTRIPIYFTFWPECNEIDNPTLTKSATDIISINWEDLHKHEVFSYKVRYRFWEDENIEPVWQEVEVFKTNYDLPINVLSYSVDIQIKRICRYENGIQITSNWTNIGSLNLANNNRVSNCSSLTGFSFDSITQNSFKVNLITSEYANPTTGPWYIVKYKEGTDPNTSWTTLYILSGNTITISGLDPGIEYSVKVQMIFGHTYLNPATICSERSSQTVTTLDWVNWLNYECGDSVITNYTIAPPASSLNEGDILKISGFDVKLTSVVGSNGTFSGEGILPIPFGKKKIAVQFQNVSVDIHHLIYSGDVWVITDANKQQKLKDSLDTNPPGEFQCIPIEKDPNKINPTTGFNEYGFDSTGHYKFPPFNDWVPGMPFDSFLDPYGFDSNGINSITDSIYDQFGCDRDGLTAEGKPCDHGGNIEYYWLYQSENHTNEGIAFFNNHEDSIRVMIIRSINKLKTENQAKIDESRLKCGGIRDSLITIAENKQLNKVFLFGEDSLYLKEGMNKSFTKEPIKYSNYMKRDAQILLLEKTHYNLYYCDKYLQQFLDMKNLLEYNLLDNSVDKLLAKIKELIISLDTLKLSKIFEHDDLNDSVFVFVRTDIVKQFYLLYNISLTYNENYMQNELENNLSKSKIKINTIGCSSVKDELLNLVSKIKTDQFKFEENNSFDKNCFYTQEFENKIFQKYNSSLSGGEVGILGPIEIRKEIGSMSYSIYLDSIRITQDGGILDAYCILQMLPSGKKLVFMLKSIEFTPGGIKNEGKLVLLSTQPISFGKGIRLIINGGTNSNSTNISWDCNGFKGIHLNADVEFCREYIVPLDENTMLPLADPAHVFVHIDLDLEKWGDLLLQVDVPPFALTNHLDYKFKIDEAWLDLSDIRNPNPIIFPKYYTHPLMNSKLWQGVYFKQITCTMPSFMKKDTSSKLILDIQNFVFDDLGVSGSFSANPLLPLSEGSMHGWAFSIDSIEITVIHNRFKEGYLDGLVNVPILRAPDNTNPNSDIQKNDCFYYTAHMDSEGNYMFKVKSSSSFKIPMLAADVVLDSTLVQIYGKDGDFTIKARLSGKLTMTQTIAGQAFNIQDIAFQNVVLINKPPYLEEIGQWQFPKIQMDLGGFELSLSKIGITSDSLMIALHTEAAIGLTTSDLGIKANVMFDVRGRLDDSGLHHKWIYKDFIVHDVYIDGSCSGLAHIQAKLSWFDNSTYGKGFQGAASVRFDKLDVEVSAVGLFGKLSSGNKYKYCMVDAKVKFASPGLTLIPPIGIVGFGGGFWYNMNSGNQTVTLSTAPLLGSSQNDDIKNLAIGSSLSGIIYAPLEGDWGIKLSMAFALANPKMMSGNVAFNMLFNKGLGGEKGGIKELVIEGNVKFMDDFNIDGSSEYASTGKPNNNAAMSAFLRMKYDFKHSSFSANGEAYLNYGNFIRGSGTNGRFTIFELVFSNEDWHVWIGTPEMKAGIILNILGITDVTIESYFDIGNKLPPPAILDPSLASFFDVSPDFTQSSFVKNGGGFMHGSSIECNFNPGKLWIFTLSAQLNLGYDLAVLNYGDVVCSNLQNEKVGINGWYASGQIWVYFKAKVGYEVDLWFTTVSGDILGLEAGILLRAQLPNPTWAQGVVKINYDILGIINGSFDFNVEIGNKCTMAKIDGSEVSPQFDLINRIEPISETKNVPVDVNPKIYFNFPMNSIFQFDSGSKIDNFTFIVNDVRILSKPGNINLYTNLSWNNEHTIMTIIPNEYLNPALSYKLIAHINIYKNGNFFKSEADTANWTIGQLPHNISLTNIKESFPQYDRQNFFIKEFDCNHGYIKLFKGQDYLLRDVPSNATNVLRVMDESNSILYEETIQYDCNLNTINFDINWSNILSKGVNYKIEVVQTLKKIKNQGGGGNFGYSEEQAKPKNDTRDLIGGGNDNGIKFPPIPPLGPGGFSNCGLRINNNYDTITSEFILLTIPFRTSIYDNMSVKLSSTIHDLAPESVNNLVYYYFITNEEGFDYYDFKGFNNLKAFLDIHLHNNSTSWISDFAKFYTSNPYGFKDANGEWTNVSDISNRIPKFLTQAMKITPVGDNENNSSPSKNINIKTWKLTYNFPSLIKNDINFMKMELKDRVLHCHNTLRKLPHNDYEYPSIEQCESEIIGNETLINQIYSNDVELNLESGFPIIILYNSKITSYANGFSSYEFFLNEHK